MKKIAIIGAGFTGLAAGFKLQEKGYRVTFFEKENQPGGLAGGFTKNNWQWTLENHYHHWFANDATVLNLAKKLNYPVVKMRPKTGVYLDKKIYQLDSPWHVLTFPKLNIWQRLQMAASLGFFKLNPFWQPLEKIAAAPFLAKTMGQKAYQMIWEPQLENKFGRYKNEISLAWFWARIHKRTANLLYPEGGFLRFARHLQKELENKGSVFWLKTAVDKIEKKQEKVEITFQGKAKLEKRVFDEVIVTTPSAVFLKIAHGLRLSYIEKMTKLKSIGALNMVLRLKKPFLTDQTYWLSICQYRAPITAIVEHTNFMEKKYYDQEHLVYLGNYLQTNDPRWRMTKEELLAFYDRFLVGINKDYKKYLLGYELFKDPFAQPIITLDYGQKMPSFKTPLAHIYLANMEQVYPWDRGTNYAVELGGKTADLIG